MTRTGDREIGVVSGRLPDNTGELACMETIIHDYLTQSRRVAIEHVTVALNK